MKKTLNIALLSRDFLLSGGSDLLRNLANALMVAENDQPLKLYLLLPVKNKIDTCADIRGVCMKTAGQLLRQRKLSLPRQEPIFDTDFLDYFRNIDGTIEFVEYNNMTGLLPALQKIEADVVLPAAFSLGQSFPYPWVGYIYDFQHKYFPSFFSSAECLTRDIHFATILRDAKAVIVNAKSVKHDINHYFPYNECEVFNLPFSASPIARWLEVKGPKKLQGYNLPERYFLISNQFWLHKSHSTAFQALSMLLNDPDYKDLHIVCTGKMEDYRHPDHIKNLQQEIRELSITDRVHFLGHIPKEDQIAIMKQALAVLQPSLFEGGPGGGSVYDAVSLGIPAILSDIPVNLEIKDEKNLFYFESGSALDLAKKIKDFLNIKVNLPPRDELIALGEQRKRLLGEHLLKTVRYVTRKTDC